MFLRIPERISSGVGHFAAWCIFALMVIGIVGIVTRFAGAPLSGIVTLSVFVFIGIVFLSLAHAQVRDQHVAVHVLTSLMPLKARELMKVVVALLSAAGCFLLCWAIWLYAWESLVIGERMDGVPYYPIYPAKICAAIGVSIFLLQLITDLVKAFRSLWQTFGHPIQSKEN